jgi:aryl-alcohol dehydrogenase-like predicted oxidoreductase
MRRVALGRTGLDVSRLGLGLAALGRPGYITLGHADDLERDYDPMRMLARAHQALDSAVALGVNYFDAARSYGDAERFLGAWLAIRGHPPESLVVASKWGQTYTAGWQVRAETHEVKDHSLPVLLRHADESRGCLGRHLAIYQIHSADLATGVLDDQEVLRHLGRLREEGWHIGLSLTGTGQSATVRRAMTVTVDGAPLFSVVQATWNLLERSAEDALAEAHASGMGVVVKEALANGRLVREPHLAKRLLPQAERLGCPLDALALAAVLARPWCHVALSGAARIEHLRSNAQALDVPWDAEAEESLASLAEPSPEYWQRRSRLGWN